MKEGNYMFNSYKELEAYVKERDIKIIDFKIITLEGKWNHHTFCKIK